MEDFTDSTGYGHLRDFALIDHENFRFRNGHQ